MSMAWVTAVITATPLAPARMTAAALSAVMPPIPTSGRRTARPISRSRSSPTGAPASGLVPVA